MSYIVSYIARGYGSSIDTTANNEASPVREHRPNHPPRRRPGVIGIDSNQLHTEPNQQHHARRDRSSVQEEYRSVSSTQSTQGHTSPSQRVIDQSDNSSQSVDPIQIGDSHSNNMEFKIFRTANNQEYTVYVRDDGNIFYVDWEQQVGVVYITK